MAVFVGIWALASRVRILCWLVREAAVNHTFHHRHTLTDPSVHPIPSFKFLRLRLSSDRHHLLIQQGVHLPSANTTCSLQKDYRRYCCFVQSSMDVVLM